MIEGRPLRFLMTVLASWTAMRLAMALPVPMIAPVPSSGPAFAVRQAPPPALPPVHQEPRGFAWMFPDPPRAPQGAGGAGVAEQRLAARAPAEGGATANGWSSSVADSFLGAQLAFARSPRPPRALSGFAPGSGLSAREAGLPGPPDADADRWSGGAWMVWRREGRMDRPLLAGSQAGARIAYALDPGSVLAPALYGRASGALNAPVAAEVALGVALRPRLPIPLTLAVERRQAVSPGGRNDFALIAATGLYPTAIGAGLRIDGYGQAGIVGIDRRDAFVDGRLTVERPIAGPDIAIGAGLWGGAQPGTARLDLGPQASLRLSIGEAAIRVGAEWRERVAGNASPASGPTLSIGTDF